MINDASATLHCGCLAKAVEVEVQGENSGEQWQRRIRQVGTSTIGPLDTGAPKPNRLHTTTPAALRQIYAHATLPRYLETSGIFSEGGVHLGDSRSVLLA